jgi:UDP-2,3-diacylglucosamine pyrophosphatase LpxH
MARIYHIVSDLHLCDVEEHADGWKAYKSASAMFDRDLAAVLTERLTAGAPEDEQVVVLNGDIIDFDLVTAAPRDPPWPVSRAERRRGMDATEGKSRWKLERVLDDHPDFVGMLVHMLAAGHLVVYVMGNHDRELHFETVRSAFTARLSARADAEAVTIDLDRMRFEPWFFHVPGEIYAEHGQQYDYYTSFRYILEPTIPGRSEPTLALPMGNLSNRELLSEMGFFNPHASNYILSAYRYFGHWLRHYAFSRRGIAIRWFVGSVVVMVALLRNKAAFRRHPPDHDRSLVALARRLDMEATTVRALDRLKRPPITDRWYRVMRELWFDRILLVVAMTGGALTLALSPVPLWISLMIPLSSFPLLFAIYEWFARGETVFSAGHEASEYARAITRLVSTPVVTFGHSHSPQVVPLGPGATYVNTGTWGPIWGPDDHETLAPGLRNVLMVRVEPGGHQCALSSCMPPDPDASDGPSAAR